VRCNLPVLKLCPRLGAMGKSCGASWRGAAACGAGLVPYGPFTSLDDFRQKSGNNPNHQREKDAGNYSDGEESRAQDRELVKHDSATPKGLRGYVRCDGSNTPARMVERCCDWKSDEGTSEGKSPC